MARCRCAYLRGQSFSLTYSMYTIHGGKDIPETDLNHLEGHKGSRPVRIGNGAADHLQLVSYTKSSSMCH